MNIKKNRPTLVFSMYLGLACAASGCGTPSSTAGEVSRPADAVSAPMPTPSTRTVASDRTLSAVELPPPALMEAGVDSPSPTACDTPSGGMNLTDYQALAVTRSDRCVGAISWAACETELNYAYSKNLITCEAFRWGRSNGYYPVVDRNDRVGAVCKCGCFEGKTLILAAEEDAATAWTPAAQIKKDSRLASLDDSSTLRRPILRAKSIKALTHSGEQPALYVFGLDSGRQLKVTQHHGMLLSNGRVVEAKSVSVGAKFVGLDGRIVQVSSITQETTKDEVYNFEVDTEDKAGHIIAAEGVLVGDLAWQNQLARELGSIAVRR